MQLSELRPPGHLILRQGSVQRDGETDYTVSQKAEAAGKVLKRKAAPNLVLSHASPHGQVGRFLRRKLGGLQGQQEIQFRWVRNGRRALPQNLGKDSGDGSAQLSGN